MCMEPMTPSNWTVWENTAKTHTNTSHSLVMLSTLDYADEKNDNGTPSMLLLKLRTSTT